MNRWVMLKENRLDAEGHEPCHVEGVLSVYRNEERLSVISASDAHTKRGIPHRRR